MKLGEFIEKFVECNSIIRLLYKENIGGEYTVVLENWNDVSMEHQILNGKGIFRHYINNEVIGLPSIYITDKYPHRDAINIIIEKLENQPYIDEKIDDNKSTSFISNK